MNASPIYGSNPYYPTTYPTPTYMPTSTYPANVQPSLINGRPVDSLEEITAGEVPLNGSLAIFPKRDGSVIYVKSTNGNGTIDTKMYIPAPEGYVETAVGSSADTKQTTISNQDILAAIMNTQSQVDDLKTLIEQQKRSRTNKSNNHNGNKEMTKNE